MLGALSFYQARGRLAPDLMVARAVAKVAGTWLERDRELQHALTVAAQLQRARTSRVTIEQAKGILAERWRVSPDEAFTALRRHARDHNQRLHLVAGKVVAGILDLSHPAA